MIKIYKTADFTLNEINSALLPTPEDTRKIQDLVDSIVDDVRRHGDEAILKYTRQFDYETADIHNIKVSEQEIDAAVRATDKKLMRSMEKAAENIAKYHEKQLPKNFLEEFDSGLTLGNRYIPFESAMCYVPTRKASIPSSLLMSTVTAKVAGVKNILVSGPAREDGSMPFGVLAAAKVVGITEIYKLGGAVAMAAFGFGTKTFPKVDTVVGPANIFGTLAKKSLFGEVGVDGMYGPSEVVVLADGAVNPSWIATDFLSQSEHGTDSQSVLITADENYAEQVLKAIGEELETSPRKEYLRKSLEDRGAIIITKDLEEGIEMANILAAEHLELAVENYAEVLPKIRSAGSILCGKYSPVAIGDYFAGPNHVLPTARSARFSSGLSVLNFLKRSSIVIADENWLKNNSEDILRLSEHEELVSHGNSVKKRVL